MLTLGKAMNVESSEAKRRVKVEGLSSPPCRLYAFSSRRTGNAPHPGLPFSRLCWPRFGAGFERERDVTAARDTGEEQFDRFGIGSGRQRPRIRSEVELSVLHAGVETPEYKAIAAAFRAAVGDLPVFHRIRPILAAQPHAVMSPVSGISGRRRRGRRGGEARRGSRADEGGGGDQFQRDAVGEVSFHDGGVRRGRDLSLALSAGKIAYGTA